MKIPRPHSKVKTRDSSAIEGLCAPIRSSTTFKLFPPRHRGEAGPADPARLAAAPPRAETGEVVLVIEDEAMVRLLIVEVG